MVQTLKFFLRRAFLLMAILLALLLSGPAGVLVAEDRLAQSWHTANRDSANLAPLPREFSGAVVQAYAARAFGWRGAFAVHTWIAVKEAGADAYTTYHVMGWRGGRKIVSRRDVPDRHWYGSRPELLIDLRGAAAAAAIPEIEAAVESYPYPDTYRAWPGPNSNTFIAWIAREVPALKLEMPPHAVGKDYLGFPQLADTAPSGSGVQVSLAGLIGFTLALDEGIELNLLGLTIGLDPEDLNIKLPGVGRVGPTPKAANP